jgi:hypothetical protein
VTQLEREIELLAIRLDAHERPRPVELPNGPPPAPSRMPS